MTLLDAVSVAIPNVLATRHASVGEVLWAIDAMSTTRQFGQVLGPAAVVAVVKSRLARLLPATYTGQPAADSATALASFDHLSHSPQHSIGAAYVESMRLALVFQMVALVIGAVNCLAVRRTESAHPRPADVRLTVLGRDRGERSMKEMDVMSQDAPGIPQVSFETDTYQVLLLRVGPKASELVPATVKRLQAEHVAYLFELQSSGKLLAAGAVATRSSAQPITGIGFFNLGSVDEVEHFVSRDPSVSAGLESAEVITFVCPKDHFSFPHAAISRMGT
jgi:uncharacterized protein YciI